MNLHPFRTCVRATLGFALALGLIGVATPANAVWSLAFYSEDVSGGKSITGWNAQGTFQRPCPSVMNIPPTISGQNVIGISDGAFEGDTCLNSGGATTSIVFPNSVVTIGDSAFRDAESLTTLTFGTGLQTIGDKAFFNNFSLGSVTLGDNVTTIGAQAFRNDESLSSLTLGSAVNTIQNYAFSGTAIAALSFPSSVATIDARAFSNNSALTSVTFAGNTEIGLLAFVDCENLQSVNFAANQTTIDQQAFTNTGIISLNIPAALTNIGPAAFAGIPTLTSVTFSGNTIVGPSVFQDCEKLQTVNFAAGQTTIGDSAFANTGLISLTIPASLTNIGPHAFSGIPTLTTVTFEGDISLLQDETFSNATSLKRVIFKSNGAYLENNVFIGVNTSAAFVIYAAGTKVHNNSSGFVAWGATYGGIPTVTTPTIGVGNGAKKIAKKSITLKPLITATSNGAVTVTVTSLVKTKSGYSVRTWCSSARTVTANSLVSINCKMGKSARNLIKAKKHTFTITFAYTQTSTGLLVSQTIPVTVKKKK